MASIRLSKPWTSSFNDSLNSLGLKTMIVAKAKKYSIWHFYNETWCCCAKFSNEHIQCCSLNGLIGLKVFWKRSNLFASPAILQVSTPSLFNLGFHAKLGLYDGNNLGLNWPKCFMKNKFGLWNFLFVLFLFHVACLFTYPCSFRLINYLPDILLVHRIEAEGKTVPSGLELLNL